MKLFRMFIKQNPYLNFMMFSISLLFFLIVFILVLNFNETKIESRVVKTFEKQHLYQISDDLINGKEKSYYEEKYSYERLNSFNNALIKSTKFSVYTAKYQPMEVIDFKGDATFSPDYELEHSEPAPEMRKGRLYYSVNTLLVNNNALTMNHLQLSEGAYFKKEAYTYEKNQVFPILLGADYKNVYQVGEILDISYYFTDFKAKIVGFINRDEKIMTSNSPETVLNKFIVMPVVYYKQLTNEQVKKSHYDDVFYRATLETAGNSFLLTRESPLQMRQHVDEISNQTGFYDFTLIGADGIIFDTLFSMSKANIQLILTINLLILGSVLLLIYFILKMKIKTNQESYVVLLISGINYQLIKRYILSEIAYLIAIALCTSYLFVVLVAFIIDDYKLVLYNAGWSIFAYVLLVICSHFLINKGFKNIAIIELLKRG